MTRPPSTLVTKLVLIAALALLGITALTSYSSIQRFFEAAQWVDHTRLVMLRLEELMSELEHAESRQRGYLISGNEQYLEPYRVTVQALPKRIRALLELTADNPERQNATGELASLVSSRLALTERGIELKRTGRFDAAAADPHLAQGRAIMDQIRALISAMKAEEEKLLENRTASFARDRISTTSIIVLGNLIALAFLLAAFTALVGEIRERKKAEAKTQRYANEVAQANAFLDSVFEYVPDMIFVKDAQDLRYVRFNQAGAALIGATPQQLIGKSDYDFFPVEQADFFTRKDRETLAGGMLVDIAEEPLSTKSQGMRILHTRKIPIPGADGTARYLLGMSEDITARKHAEGQIAELNAQLRVRAAQLEASNQELESFSYTVSHDLRAPLRAIAGYARMLQEDYHDKLDNEARRFLSVIGENTRRMGKLIDDLLAFARLGRQSMTHTDVDMSALVREVFADLTELTEQSWPELMVEALPAARGDRQLLRQVWANLLSNAVKYSSNTPCPRIEITGFSNSAEHVYCVKDNGVGFDMKHYDKLFGVFERLHDAQEFSGTGVGLAIVQRIVERHAGRVWAQAKLDEGAMFYFSLPTEQPAQ